jgi:hypothetical protein
MSEFIKLLSTYNLFNYLFPGYVFIFYINLFTNYAIPKSNILTEFFLAYFLGLVISRIGSLIIKPILDKFNFIEYADYEKFVKASKLDSKIDLLLEVNNMYRTLIALFLICFLFLSIDIILKKMEIILNKDYLQLSILLLGHL